MPNWNEVMSEIKAEASFSPLDRVRRKYLEKIHDATGRNVIAYYSGWLQHPGVMESSINDKDKNAFMLNIHKLDRTKGLDLILHTPGGDLAATESLVSYLRSMFTDIRAIVPQISMSAGTMIAFACNTIMMGKQSNLGPIDPQIGGVPCEAVLDEFAQAKKDVIANPDTAAIWQPIIGKYHPTFLNSCYHAMDYAKKLAHSFLKDNMLKNEEATIKTVLDLFSSHNETKSHSRHISKEQCTAVGLKITDMESDNELQDTILTAHHAFMHTLAQTSIVKIVENHTGTNYHEVLQD